MTRIAALTQSPIATPPPSVQAKAGRTLAALEEAPDAITERPAKPTAETPSFKRLSDSTTIDTRGTQPISLNAAMTEIGSVAAIRTPNNPAPIQLQPINRCIPAATTAAAM